MKLPSKIAKLALVSLAFLLSLGVWFSAGLLAERGALDRLREDATLIARQQTRLIDSELAKFRLLPVVLKEYSDLRDVLAGGSRDATARLNQKLELVAHQIGSPIIYVIARDGTVIASSNANTPESFVGRNYDFRPYFKGAMAAGSAEYYAIGDLSGRFGLFLAQRIGNQAGPVGVVVIKFEFHRLVQTWSNDPGQTFVVDPRGIILASTDKFEDLRSFQPITTTERAQIIESGQFNAADMKPSNYRFAPEGMMIEPSGGYSIAVDEPIAGTALKLVHIEPTGPALRAANDLARLVTVAAMLVFVIIAGAIYWRASRAARAAAYRTELESAVEERTAALSAEMAERELADKRFRDAREELAQANRLASLGSITAGLVHEINQPVATIRTLAENAQHHLANGKLDKVASNLSTSVELTARIGSITQEMRRFARRRSGIVRPLPLNELVDGTMLLMGDRFHNANVRLDIPERSDMVILACRIRSEQVLVNLLQNALDAVATNHNPRVVFSVREEGDQISLVVDDNGKGIEPKLADEIFSPFVTGKADGLGLGLGIARDLMTEMEGTLHVIPSRLGGAAFAATLRRAGKEGHRDGK
ncbi:sensor histidine kinase [Brucella intermedia]|uniref:sensor histidine kinase n=1 Tax=Brucella intermedia TaxID=94625 RepID=UPI00124BFF1F|nr:ATP-binding protein [Brucella intermedia]KAB2727498.1 sensor histidine kinase [Brucella intermedia]